MQANAVAVEVVFQVARAEGDGFGGPWGYCVEWWLLLTVGLGWGRRGTYVWVTVLRE